MQTDETTQVAAELEAGPKPVAPLPQDDGSGGEILHASALDAVHETEEPRASSSHGLLDPNHFHTFQRNLKEELATATNDSEASCGHDDRQHARLFSEELQGSESEGVGETIDEVEYTREKESSDEENSQDLSFINNEPKTGQNPLITYGQMNAAIESDSEPSLSQLLVGRFKRRAPAGATGSPQNRRRPRVVHSSPEPSADLSPANQSQQRGSDKGGTDQPMLDAGASSDDAPRPEDDGSLDEFDLDLLDEFAICEIVPRARSRAGTLPSAAGALLSLLHATGVPPSELSTPVLNAPQPDPVDAPPSPAIPCPPQNSPAAPAVLAMPAAPNAAPPVARAVPRPAGDRCAAAARHLHGLGVASLTFNMKVWSNDKGEEKKGPLGLMRDWGNKCDLDNCLREGVRPGRSCLAIVTEASDIYALDVDTKDGGGEAFERMLAEHGPLPDDTPWEWTGNRPGRHFFFSLSQSKAAGLLSGAGRARLTYKGEKVGLDTRGEGGMLFVGPSSYKGLDGAVRRYEWVQEIAPDRANLRAIPLWLTAIINSSDAPASAPSDRAPLVRFNPTEDEEATVQDAALPPPPAVLKRVEECVAATGDSHSRFEKLKRLGAADMYVFRVNGPRVCPYEAHHSGSNNFFVLVRGSELVYHCHSSECSGIQPKRGIGQLTPRETRLVGETAPVAAEDSTVYTPLTKSFVDYWAHKGDMGGSEIATKMYAQCNRLWYDGKSWWMWDGQRFRETGDSVVLFVIMHQLSTVYDRRATELEDEFEKTSNEEEKKVIRGLLGSLKNYNGSNAVAGTLAVMKGQMQKRLAEEFDADPDILNLHNGVLDLRTGQLDVHRPGYRCTKMAGASFRGLDFPTPTIDSFLSDIFNDDRPLIEYMERLWGYAINGSTSEELIAFLLGSGGNGKGVVKQMLESTLGEYFSVMAKDAVVKALGQRPPSKGAATGYLAELQGFRVAITDETSPGERVDLGLVLGMTGGGQVSARLLYRNNVMFRFSHTPFIQTNYDPEIPPTLAKQPNVQRRLIVVQFPNEYVSQDKYDETNPRHRRVDTGLKERMEAPAVREEFLTFLIQGSVAYFANPKVLRTHPAAIQAATAAWLGRGDKLQTFLRTEHVIVGEDKVAWEDELWGQFQAFAGIKISKEELCRQMGEKGYARTKKGGRFDGDPSKRMLCYLGLSCEYE
ncbi:hypothetical protein KFL_007640060 [Klebsormidium nitens]|uniref:SF3 helicase domain-containing protein n=1 Tax=Klebsormidium nitens TaxID=105231 RepID=A0A1Y1IP97_KLENI|nr:hypothetical protein KFL_007640060 [Klebsormidium nitens]|eukprot:GAQ91319.1 hypothetical protein KFL_007640060 [Klebsormidium nitens]